MTAMRLTLLAEPAAAGEARHAVTTFARKQGAVNGAVADIALAVSEAVANVILHAYRDRPRAGDVTVAAERSGKDLRVLVCDDGLGVTPRTDSPGLGLGLALIGRLAQSLEVRGRAGGGAEICMTFRLRGGA